MGEVRRFRVGPADAFLGEVIFALVKVVEGDIVKAVQCSFPSVTTRKEALEITARSAVHRMCDYVKADAARRQAFVAIFGAAWAPVGAANDPRGLNQNWTTNVTKLWAPTTQEHNA